MRTLAIAGLLLLAGCASQSASLAPAEEKQFKGGGPMSEEAKREIAKRMGSMPKPAQAAAPSRP